MFVRILDWLLALGSLAGFALLGLWAVYQSPSNAQSLEQSLQHQAESVLYATGQDWAKVEMDGQRATLSGVAPSPEALERARLTVLESEGAGGFIFGGVTVIEDGIASIADLPVISPYVWTATKTDDARIILTGHVPSEDIRSDILSDAELIAPGNVEDRTRLGSGQPDGDWQRVARIGLRQFDLIETGYARLSDTRLAVSGIAMNDAARIQASAEVANIAAPYSGHPAIRGASLWSASHDARGLLLTGRISTEDERAEIVAMAAQYYSGEVIDEMTVADQNHDGWMDGVRLGLPHFTQFQSGEMGFAPESVGFTFEGEASGSTLSYLAEDMGKLTGPYGVVLKAETVQVEVAELEGIDFSGDSKLACQAGFDAVLAGNKVYFASGNAEITRESGITLDKLMAVAAQCDEALVFELGGHTDNQGERAFNVWLSLERAKAVSGYMTSGGITATRLTAIGHGPDIPAADNSTWNGRAQNRRIEFTVKDGNE